MKRHKVYNGLARQTIAELDGNRVHISYLNDRSKQAFDIAVTRINADLDTEAQHGAVKVYSAAELAAFAAQRGLAVSQ